MPNYDYECDSCGYTFEESFPISQRKIPEGRCMECNNGDIRQIIGVPGIGDPIRMGLRKPDATFREHLKEIKRKHRSRHTNINTW
jgi:putative FmdB family regulatory protein